MLVKVFENYKDMRGYYSRKLPKRYARCLVLDEKQYYIVIANDKLLGRFYQKVEEVMEYGKELFGMRATLHGVEYAQAKLTADFLEVFLEITGHKVLDLRDGRKRERIKRRPKRVKQDIKEDDTDVTES